MFSQTLNEETGNNFRTCSNLVFRNGQRGKEKYWNGFVAFCRAGLISMKVHSILFKILINDVFLLSWASIVFKCKNLKDTYLMSLLWKVENLSKRHFPSRLLRGSISDVLSPLSYVSVFSASLLLLLALKINLCSSSGQMFSLTPARLSSNLVFIFACLLCVTAPSPLCFIFYISTPHHPPFISSHFLHTHCRLSLSKNNMMAITIVCL